MRFPTQKELEDFKLGVFRIADGVLWVIAVGAVLWYAWKHLV